MRDQPAEKESPVDLGAASVETKGELAGMGESVGRFRKPGLYTD